MASIPLLCNICPKEPDFSDISHLLTHVASKGHLAHYFKAQVRARQDPSIRGRLDTYDRWYERYQIQKLLSERMAAKESKDTSSKRSFRKVDAHSATGTKEKKACKKRATAGLSQQGGSPNPANVGEAIDPQLSQSLIATPRNRKASPCSYGLPNDPAARHRAYVPRMGAWHNASPLTHESTERMRRAASNTSHLVNGSTRDGDEDSDYFQTFLRSPSRTAYPDPDEFASLPTGLSPARQVDQKSTVRLPRELSSEADTAGLIQSPILKGVRWPGMSLFDSASLEAQRRRNQKKDGSILEQMESNSTAVEQLERIYWPNGELKMERFITGSVESSPPRELTPPPVPTKRQRVKANKAALADLSTNAPKIVRKRRTRKATTDISNTQASNLQNLSEKALATMEETKFTYPRSIHTGYLPIDEEESERQLTFEATNNGRGRNFEIFSDEVNGPADYHNTLASTTADTGPQTARCIHSASHSHGSSFPRRRTPLGAAQAPTGRQVSARQDRFLWDCQSHVSGGNFLDPPMEDRENIQPVFDSAGRVDDSAGPLIHQRVTQRYFSVTGNQPPQFFSSLPPQMDFGGLAEPKYYGSTLNPLNTQLRPQHFPTHNAQAHLHYPMSTGCPADAANPRTSSATTRSTKRTR